MPLLYDGLLAPVELAPGRGDLRLASIPITGGMIGAAGGIASSVALAGGRRVSFAQLFLTQPMVAAAVGWLLAESLRVPLKVYRRTGDDSRVRLRPADHPLAAAIAEPWERGSSGQFVMALLGSLSVHGNGLLEVDDGAQGRLRFVTTDYRFARPIMPWRDSIAGWTLDDDDETVRRARGVDTVLHVAWWSPFGPLGISPLQQLGVTLNIEDAAQRHQEAMLANSARPPSAITASDGFLGLKMDERQLLLANLRADITALYAGPENNGRPAILPPGLDWKPIGHTAVEAQLMEQRHVARAEVGAVYRIAPGCFGLGLDKGGKLEEQRQASYVDGLLPPLILIEQAINSQVIRALLREDDVYVEFDVAGILRGDRLNEVTALRESIASALMTPNEARAVLNMPQSTDRGMNEHYLPRNNLWPLAIPYPANGMGGQAADPAAATAGKTTARISATKASAPDVTSTSVMVAFYTTADLAQALAVDSTVGLAADDLHLTLAYLGDVDASWDLDALRATVAGWAAATAPVDGTVSGKGLFIGGETPVTYASLDLPGLPSARELLVALLTGAGFPPSSAHGFTPHMTIAYADLPEWQPQPSALTFDRVALVIGDDRNDFDLAGAPPPSEDYHDA